ncbi:MAG: carboxypeptidase regulatory-like domain-containing protein [Candidatus Dormiibacterota bacterium]
MIDSSRSARRSHGHAFATSLRAVAALTLVLSGTVGAGSRAIASTAVPAAQTLRAATISSHGTVGSASTAIHNAAPASSNPPHIMVIVEENESYSNIIGSSSAPYINSLANTYASATNWYAVQHNSPHDYLDLIVGSDLGLPAGKPYANTTLVDELHSAGIPWKSYMESMPSNCFMGTTSDGLYDPNHNPFHYFKNYTGTSGWCSSGNLSTEGVLPIPPSGLVSALNGANAPDFVFLVPNDCDDMHGGVSACANSSNSQLIKAGDTWLNSNLAPVLTSLWFQQNGIVIITWDEGNDKTGCCGLSSPGGHVVTLAIASGNAGAGSFTSTGDHYGTLRAIEEAYGVGLLGGSSNAVNGDLSGAFGHSTTGSIGGVVTDSVTTAAIAGASVSYTGSTGNGSTTTDSGGNYTFSGVAPGSYTVTASAGGHTTQTASVTVTAGTLSTKSFALVPTVGSISGTVTDAQTTAGLVGASVTCTCGGSVTTGTGGAYSVANVAPGTYSMTFSATGYVSQTIPGVVVTAGHVTTESPALTEDGSITGQVTDSVTHAAIVGATVSCTCQGTNATTDSSGNYSLLNVAPSSTYSMTFSATGYGSQIVNNVVVTAGDATTESAALSSAPGLIQGNVTDATATGHPVLAGVSVSCTCQGAPVTTNASGNYSFAAVAAGTYSLTFTDSGWVTLTINNVIVTAGNATTKNAALVEDGSLNGNVNDVTTSADIIGATVTCSCQVGTVATDGSGNYSFPNIAPGNYSLTFSDTGYVTLVVNNVAVVAGTLTTTNVALTEDGSITGTVTDATASGNPTLPGVTVTCSCQVATATTDVNGNYSFPNITPGTYSLTFALPGYVTSTINTVSVTSGNVATESAALTEDGGFNGTVTDSTKAPIQGVTVTCNGCGVSSATTDSSGNYSFGEIIAPGTYSLTFNDTGYVTQTISGQVVNAGASTEVDAVMTTDGGIAGTVTDLQTSLPITGALVTCGLCPTTTATTDGSGRYAFTLVPNGTYTLVVTASGYVNRTVTGVGVTGPATTTRNPMMDEEGGISGNVTDAQTTLPLQGVTVTCAACPTTTTTTDSSGDYAFTLVPNGSAYTVTFALTAYVTQTITGVTVIGPTSTMESPALNEDGGVTGTVTDSVTHAAIANATVTCTCQAAGTTTNSSGTYMFTLITPGSYTVTVTATGYTGQTSAPFSVNAGAATTQNFQLVSTAKPLGVVQSFGKPATTAGTTLTATTGTATTLGDLLVVTLKDRSTTLTNVTGITDSSGVNTWTKATSIQSGGQADEEIWYVANAKSVTSVTVTVSGSAALAMTVIEISGAPAAPLDRTMTASGTGTAVSTGTTTTTAQASEIVIANIGWNSTVTPSGQTAGYTVLPLQQATVPSNATGEQGAWRIVTTTGAQSYAATLSASVAWAGAIATFK